MNRVSHRPERSDKSLAEQALMTKCVMAVGGAGMAPCPVQDELLLKAATQLQACAAALSTAMALCRKPRGQHVHRSPSVV